MTKIDLFCLLFRDAMQLLNTPLDNYLKAVTFVQLHSRSLINYLETTDIPMSVTLTEVVNYHYRGGELPRIYVNNREALGL